MMNIYVFTRQVCYTAVGHIKQGTTNRLWQYRTTQQPLLLQVDGELDTVYGILHGRC